ncbi:MAG: DciA family protein [Colwellia sp.]
MARKSKVPINMAALLKTTTGTLAHIQTKTNSLTALADIVRQICPDLPVDAWHIANSRQDTLIIEVKSPVWGQRLQFERNNICNALSSSTDGNFYKIEIKVNPQGFRQSRHEVTEKKHAELMRTADIKAKPSHIAVNEKTAKQFLAIAKNAPKGLKEKLEKLALVAGTSNES